MAAKTNKQMNNEIVDLENKLEIEKISKQISEHAEALYRTWKSTNLGVPKEFLDFYAMETSAPTLDAVVASTNDINTAEDLQKLVNSFVIRDKEKRGILKNRYEGGKIIPPSDNRQTNKQSVKQMASSLPNSLYQSTATTTTAAAAAAAAAAAITPILQESHLDRLDQNMEGQQIHTAARNIHNKQSTSSSKSLARNKTGISSGMKMGKSGKSIHNASRQTAIIAPYHTANAIPSINTTNSLKSLQTLQNSISQSSDKQETNNGKADVKFDFQFDLNLNNPNNPYIPSQEYSTQNIKQLLHATTQKKNTTKIPTLSATSSLNNNNSLTLNSIPKKMITPESNYSVLHENLSKSYQALPIKALNTTTNTNAHKHNDTESEINIVQKADNRITNSTTRSHKKLMPTIKFSETNLVTATEATTTTTTTTIITATSSIQTPKVQLSTLTISASPSPPPTTTTPITTSVFKQKKLNASSKRNQEVRKFNNSNSNNSEKICNSNSSNCRPNNSTSNIDDIDNCNDDNTTSSANTIAINNINTTTATNTTKPKRTTANNITESETVKAASIDQLAALSTKGSSNLRDLQTATNNSSNSLIENNTKHLQITDTKSLKTNKNKSNSNTFSLTNVNTEAALDIITNSPSIPPDEGMDEKHNHGRKSSDSNSGSTSTATKTMPTFIKNKLLHGPDKNFRSPFLMRGSVAERVMIFEKCPDSNKAFPNIKRPDKIDLNRKMPFKVKLHSMPQTPSDQNLLQKEIRNLKNTYIPRFHFPHGKPPPTISTERTLRDILSAFEVFPNNQATKDELGRILKICDMPFYWRMPVMHCCRPQNNSNLIERQRFIEFWKQMSVYCHDAASQFIYILSRGQRNRHYILPEDLIPLVQDVVDTHPGLAFLKEATEFHSRYIHTVISRIFYTVNRSWSGRINISELRRSDLLEVISLLEEEEDINQIMAYFSYEHFYVIYCKFWELDKDHDLLINPEDLSKYGDYALSTRIIERLFSGCVTRKNKYSNIHNDAKMSYTDFVWFLLSEEDKRSPTAIEYWFRCMDIDGDGVLSMYELEYFYEEQQQRLESIGIESLPFEDCLCQMLDMIKPQNPGGITLGDLKRCKMTPIFFDTFFNLEKYLDHEQRDPFVTGRNDYISDWDRFAAQEYEALIMEEND